MANPDASVPVRLAESDLDSPLAGRVAFVDSGGISDWGIRGTAAPHVAVPATPSDLFGRGLHSLFRNYLVTRGVSGGIAALCDDAAFLRAIRRLADRVYASALARHGASRIVDASPSNTEAADVIRAVYPDAPTLRSRSDAAALADAWSAPAGPVPALAPAAPVDLAPIFVVGMPRSGTTWVEHMLCAHPAIDGPGSETAIFVSLRALANNAARPADEGIAGWIDEEEMFAAMREFVEGLFAHYLQTTGSAASSFLEKTPLHAEHLDLIHSVFPGAPVISVYRDGRDVVRSLLEMESATDDVVVAASRWTEITATTAAALRTLPRARDERYETLLADPVGSVADLLSWLGLPPDPATLAELGRRATERVSQYNTTGDVGSGKWRSLSARNLRAVHRHAGERLVDMGYMSRDELDRALSGVAYRVDTAIRRLRRR